MPQNEMKFAAFEQSSRLGFQRNAEKLNRNSIRHLKRKRLIGEILKVKDLKI